MHLLRHQCTTHDNPVEIIGAGIVPVAHAALKRTQTDTFLPVSHSKIIHCDVASEDVERIAAVHGYALQHNLRGKVRDTGINYADFNVYLAIAMITVMDKKHRNQELKVIQKCTLKLIIKFRGVKKISRFSKISNSI